MGNLWAGQHLLSVSLSGDINYLDPAKDKPVRTVYGHQKGITAFAVKPSDKTFYTGSYDGRVYAWSEKTGLASPVTGSGHTNQVTEITLGAHDKLVSSGMDDAVRSFGAGAFEYDFAFFCNIAACTDCKSAVPRAFQRARSRVRLQPMVTFRWLRL